MKFPRWLREPAVIVALIGLPVGTTTLMVGDMLDNRNAAIEHRHEAEQRRCDRAFEIARDEALNPVFAEDREFLEQQKRIARNCDR